MATNEPLLRMAISRGLLLDLEQTPEDTKDSTKNSSVSDTHTEIKPTGESKLYSNQTCGIALQKVLEHNLKYKGVMFKFAIKD